MGPFVRSDILHYEKPKLKHKVRKSYRVGMYYRVGWSICADILHYEKLKCKHYRVGT